MTSIHPTPRSPKASGRVIADALRRVGPSIYCAMLGGTLNVADLFLHLPYGGFNSDSSDAQTDQRRRDVVTRDLAAAKQKQAAWSPDEERAKIRREYPALSARAQDSLYARRKEAWVDFPVRELEFLLKDVIPLIDPLPESPNDRLKAKIALRQFQVHFMAGLGETRAKYGHLFRVLNSAIDLL